MLLKLRMQLKTHAKYVVSKGSPMPTQNSIKVYESPNINGFLWIYNDF